VKEGEARRGAYCNGFSVVADAGGYWDGRTGRYQCPLCDQVFPQITAIRAHLDQHYPRDSPNCPACSRTFAHPNSVRNHMRLKHLFIWEQMKYLKWS